MAESFENIFIEKFGLTPTVSQLSLIQEIYTYFKDPTRGAFVLTGYAGTGKTSLMGACVKTLEYYGVQTILLAPTGRAAKVFSQKSNKDAFTIHKHIYWRKSTTEFGSPLTVKPNLFKNTIFIVDEASMIGDYSITDNDINSRNLLEDLLEYVFKGKNCKLILLGDEGQLPPVGCDHSPALDLRYLEHHFPTLKFRKFQLTEVLRQAEDSEILFNATRLRVVEWEDYPKFKLLNSSDADLIRIDGGDLQDFLESSYNEVGIEETLVITRSNKNANGYNLQIRGRVFWFEEELCSNDYLMVVKNNYFWQDDKSKMGFIANGEQLIVKRILKREQLYGFDFVHALVVFVDYEDLGELEVVLHTEALTVEAPSLSRNRMKELFYAVEQDYIHIKNKKERYDLILKDRYFNALQVKYAYAVTCHKSQGGQWANVFIDQGFISDDILGPDYYRWLYTALTRATEKVYLVNFADEFFEDNL